MPILNVTVGAMRSLSLTQEISHMLSEATSTILGKDPKVTAIAVGYINPEDWIVAGSSLAVQGRASFQLEIKVTDETNTKDEKARYIEAVFNGFNRILGSIHEESYIHVHDVRAASYGYGGQTQEYRYHHR